MESFMKKNKIAYLVISLLGLLISNSLWAEGGRGHGAGGAAHTGGRHNGGGNNHYGGGHHGGGNIHHGGGHYGGGNIHYGGGNHYAGGWGYGRGGQYYGRSNFDFYFGAPIYPYFSNPYPYYYPPSVITVPIPITPPVYIQQPQPAAQQYPAGYWYYCTNPEGYYPYVKACPSGWQQVNPIPPVPR